MATASPYKDLLMDLLETIVHQLLYVRCVYPNNVFEPRIKFGVPVKRCVHPKVNSFIEKKLKSISQFDFKDLKCVDVVILKGNSEEEGILSVQIDENSLKSPFNEDEVERHFRAFLLKINSLLTHKSAKNDENRSFTFRVHSKTDRNEDEELNLDWAVKSDDKIDTNVIIPIHCMKNPFYVQMLFNKI